MGEGTLSTPQKPVTKKTYPFQKSVEILFFLCAFVSVAAIAIMTAYIFIQGTPAIIRIGPLKFLFGTEWVPSQMKFGILPMIVTSLIATLISTVIGSVIGILTAVFLSELAPKWLYNIVKPCVELLAGIPSVVYGYFGMTIIVPFIRRVFPDSQGFSLLAVIVVLSVMVLPTIISISQSSLRAVPSSYKEGSLALGASHIETVFRAIVPAARSGILASVMLGIGRAVGETMAVIMVAGNIAQMPSSLMDTVRTLTINIAFELNYATGLHREALFATGVVLFVIIMILNIILNTLLKKREVR
jgi:phosphate transport system permease protein